MFTSDNGLPCGHLGFWGKGNGTFPLNVYANSVKVPMILSHPGRIPLVRGEFSHGRSVRLRPHAAGVCLDLPPLAAFPRAAGKARRNPPPRRAKPAWSAPAIGGGTFFPFPAIGGELFSLRGD